MRPGPPLRRRTLIATALGMAGLTACAERAASPGSAPAGATSPAGESGGSDGGRSGPSPTPDAPPPSAAATTVLRYGRAEVVVGVRPVVRHRGHQVLTLDLVAEDPAGDLGEDPAAVLSRVWGSSSRAWQGVRLLDLEGDAVTVPALEDGVNAFVRTTVRRGSAPLEAGVQLVFADLGTDAVALYLPKAPLLPSVPVLDAEPPSLGAQDEPIDPGRAVAPPPSALVALSVDLARPVREERRGGDVTVDIGADVLFDPSSAELTDEARNVLDDAAARLLEHEPGPVTVVGHTDDVDGDAFNLDLSHRRAEAVAEALRERIDAPGYPMTTDGRGESAPIADNATAEGRARNRRVELQLSTPRRTPPGTGSSEGLPPFSGETAPGLEGLVVTPDLPRPAHLRVREARLVAGHLVVTLEAVVQDEEVDSAYGLGGFSENPLLRDDLHLAHTDGGLGVVTGSTLTLPAFHLRAEDDDLVPLSDLSTGTRIDGGLARVIELVYPRDIAGIAPGSIVAMQLGTQGFRLTDIPVSG